MNTWITFYPSNTPQLFGITNILTQPVRTRAAAGAWSKYLVPGVYGVDQGQGLIETMLVPTTDGTYWFSQCTALASNALTSFAWTNSFPTISHYIWPGVSMSFVTNQPNTPNEALILSATIDDTTLGTAAFSNAADFVTPAQLTAAVGTNITLNASNGIRITFSDPTNAWIEATNETTAGTIEAVQLWRSGVFLASYATPTLALAAATNGDVVLLSPGQYVVTNALTVPTNVTLRGAGPMSTVIVNQDTNVVGGHLSAGIVLSTGCRVEALQVTNYFMDTYCQRCIGVDSVMDDSPAVRWEVSDVVTFGDCDNLFFYHTNKCSGVFRNSTFSSKWDTCNLAMGEHEIELYHCTLLSLGPSTFSPTSVSRALSSAYGTKVTGYGTVLYGSNSVTAGPTAQAGATDVWNFYGGAIGWGGSNVPVTAESGSIVNLYGCAVDQTKQNFTDVLYSLGTLAATNIYAPSPDGAAREIVLKSTDGFNQYPLLLTSTGTVVASTFFATNNVQAGINLIGQGLQVDASRATNGYTAGSLSDGFSFGASVDRLSFTIGTPTNVGILLTLGKDGNLEVPLIDGAIAVDPFGPAIYLDNGFHWTGDGSGLTNIPAAGVTGITSLTNATGILAITAQQTNVTAIRALTAAQTNAANILAITAQQTNAANIIAIGAPLTNAAGVLAITAQQTNGVAVLANNQIWSGSNYLAGATTIAGALSITNVQLGAFTNIVCGRIPMVVGGVTYYLTVSTNSP
jgi:hypothetical protein